MLLSHSWSKNNKQPSGNPPTLSPVEKEGFLSCRACPTLSLLPGLCSGGRTLLAKQRGAQPLTLHKQEFLQIPFCLCQQHMVLSKSTGLSAEAAPSLQKHAVVVGKQDGQLQHGPPMPPHMRKAGKTSLPGPGAAIERDTAAADTSKHLQAQVGRGGGCETEPARHP